MTSDDQAETFRALDAHYKRVVPAYRRWTDSFVEFFRGYRTRRALRRMNTPEECARRVREMAALDARSKCA